MNTNKVILKPLFQKKADPLTLLLKDIFKDNRNAMSYLGALSIGLGFSQTDSAFAEEDVEEVVVTAEVVIHISMSEVFLMVDLETEQALKHQQLYI